MSISSYLKLKGKFELQQYVRSENIDKKAYISFYGSPKKHPHEQNRVILIADPFSHHTFYYEFNVEDIASVQEMPNISTLEGDAIPMVRIWVKKGSVAMRCTPFIVDSII